MARISRGAKEGRHGSSQVPPYIVVVCVYIYIHIYIYIHLYIYIYIYTNENTEDIKFELSMTKNKLWVLAVRD